LLAALLSRLLLLARALLVALLRVALLTRILRGLVLLARAVLAALLDIGTLMGLVVIHDFLLLLERTRNISRQQECFTMRAGLVDIQKQSLGVAGKGSLHGLRPPATQTAGPRQRRSQRSAQRQRAGSFEPAKPLPDFLASNGAPAEGSAVAPQGAAQDSDDAIEPE
jgi:hypothetical protein